MDAKLIEISATIDAFAEDLGDAVAAENFFWLGADRRIPGDKRRPLRLSRDAQALVDLMHFRFARVSIAQLQLISNETLAHTAKADALELLLKRRMDALLSQPVPTE